MPRLKNGYVQHVVDVELGRIKDHLPYEQYHVYDTNSTGGIRFVTPTRLEIELDHGAGLLVFEAHHVEPKPGYLTADGIWIRPGLTVWTNDLKRGDISNYPPKMMPDPWFDVVDHNGNIIGSYNGTRLSVREYGTL